MRGMLGEDRHVADTFFGRMVRNLGLDMGLLLGLGLVATFGLMVVYSASGQDLGMVGRQALRMALALGALVVCAQITPHQWRQLTPWVFAFGMLLLVAVEILGDIGKGAQRWLDLGFIRFQPSEMMKLGVPMMVAWYLHERPLPPTLGQSVVIATIIGAPALLIFKQPDLGTAVLVSVAGVFALYCSGIRWRWIIGSGLAFAAALPFLWGRLHAYQQQRVLTFLDPERDPLGSGYHIIQSKIAIGSGGLFGKGWLNGTQSQLEFLPERHTDFIFAVIGEEFGLLGALLLVGAYAWIILRSLQMAAGADKTYGRLLGGALALTFLVYVFVNIGMVTGLLPVVGVPLPLISYGGTSMVTLMAGFGILMSIHRHRKLMSL